MSKVRKFLALLLAIIIALSTVPTSDVAAKIVIPVSRTGSEVLYTSSNTTVSASTDDVTFYAAPFPMETALALDSTILLLGSQGKVTAHRFPLYVEHGANITYASITIEAYQADSAVMPVCYIYCEDIGNAATFSDVANINSRSWTENYGEWTPPEFAGRGYFYTTTSFANAVQEVVDRDDWTYGNYIAVVIVPQENTTSLRYYYSWDDITRAPPQLDVEWEMSGFAVVTSPVKGKASSSVRLNGFLYIGDEEEVDVSFEYGTESGVYTDNTSPSESMTQMGGFYFDLTDLVAGETYYMRAKAVGDTTVYGSEKSFTLRERPSLYFSLDELDTFKALKTAPTHSAIYDNIEEWANDHLDDTPPAENPGGDSSQRVAMLNYMAMYIENMAFMYYMTDNTDYRDDAVAWLVSFLDWTLWGHGEVWYTTSNWQMLLGIARTVGFGYDALCDYIDMDDRVALADRLVQVLEEFLGLDQLGGWTPDSWAVWFPQTIAEIVGCIGVAALALQDDYIESDDWMDFAIYHYNRLEPKMLDDGAWWCGTSYQLWGMQSLIPFMVAHKRINSEDLFEGNNLQYTGLRYIYSTYPTTGGYGIQFEDTFWGIDYLGYDEVDGYLTLRHLGDFYMLASEYGDSYTQWFANNYAAQYRIWSYIWKNPDISPTAPTDLPLSKWLDAVGYVLWRTGWGNNDLLVAFKSGYSIGHAHPSNNSFALYLDGVPLTCEVGYWSYAPTWTCNSMLANGAGQTFLSDIRGEILTVEENLPYYRYVSGNASDPYEGALDKFIRQVVMVKDEYIVVYDDVAATPQAVFDWLLHAPYIAGGHGSTPSISITDDVITLTGSAGGYVNVKVVEPAGFSSAVVPYYNSQSKQCYYAKISSDNVSDTQFLNVIFPSTDNTLLPVEAVSQNNCSGVIITDDVTGDKWLTLFSNDGASVDEYIELGGYYYPIDGETYSFSGTTVRAQFEGYIVMGLGLGEEEQSHKIMGISNFSKFMGVTEGLIAKIMGIEK